LELCFAEASALVRRSIGDRRLAIGKLAIGDNPSPIPGARPKASLIPARATPWEKATDFHRRPTACLIP